MKILVADDHALMREGLIGALRDAWPDATFVEAADAPETLQALGSQCTFDLVLLDLFMPGADGLRLLSSICDDYPDTRVVVISAADDPADMRRALDYGAVGFIPKSTARSVILGAVQLVLAGGVYLPPQLFGRDRQPEPPSGSPNLREAPQTNGLPLAELTERQVQVLKLLGQGLSNKRIARALGLAENTVKIHVAAIFRALGASNRTQAVMTARTQGLFGDE